MIRLPPRRFSPRRPEQERPQVLDHLDPGEPRARHVHVHDPAVPGDHRIHGADGAAGGHDVGIDEHRPHQPHQRAALDQGVGVDGAHQLAAGEVEADVERVGLAAVQLVDDHQVGVAQRTVERDHALGGHVRRVGAIDLDQRELTLQHADGVVLAAVGDDDHLEVGVVEREQRLHAGGDRRFFVVGGRQDADRRRQARPDHDVVADAHGFVARAAHLDDGGDEQREVAEVEQSEIDEDGGVDRPGQRLDPGDRRRAHDDTPAAARSST